MREKIILAPVNNLIHKNEPFAPVGGAPYREEGLFLVGLRLFVNNRKTETG